MKPNTIIIYNDDYYGIINAIEPNVYSIVQSNGTISGVLDLDGEEYTIVSTHENLPNMLIEMDELINND